MICCSTLENSTSSWVNWLVSIGLVGSWFCNCVISIPRKSWKLELRLVSALVDTAADAVLPVDAAAAAATGVIELGVSELVPLLPITEETLMAENSSLKIKQ